MDVKWENPPLAMAGRNARPDEMKLAAALREHPDRWARMVDFDDGSRAANLAQQIRLGKRAAFRTDDPVDGEFEAVSRRVPDSTLTAVYVRYATLRND